MLSTEYPRRWTYLMAKYCTSWEDVRHIILKLKYNKVQEAADALNKAFNNLTETLTKTLQPLIDALSRPEVAKALEALGKERVKEKTLREEISKAFEEFSVSGTPYSSFTIFEAGYHAGMKRGDKDVTRASIQELDR